MTLDDGSKEGATWPMPRFNFEVDFGTTLTKVAFQEVSGMDTEHQIIEYHESSSPLFSTEKMPGIVKNGNVTMKKGVFINNNAFWTWRNEITMNTIKRQTVLIRLLDENGNAVRLWTLKNAWPTRISGTDLKSDGNEIAVDTIEIAHEQLIVTNPGI